MNAPATAPSPRRLAYIVDDEPMLLDLNETVLRSLGFEVKRFRAAELAYEAYRLEHTPPDIIVTDYSMHRMSGADLIEACRKLHPHQKFLLISGTVGFSVLKHATELPDHFMAKPYLMDEFATVVKQLTEPDPTTAGR